MHAVVLSELVDAGNQGRLFYRWMPRCHP